MKLPIPGSTLLSPGVVLELFVPVITTPKFKFCAFVSDDDSPLYFLINSEINGFIGKRQDLLEQQVSVPKSELDQRLYKDSYLDCSQPYDNFTRQEICAQLDADNGCYMGRLSDDVLGLAVGVVAASLTVRPVEQQVIIAGLNGVLGISN